MKTNQNPFWLNMELFILVVWAALAITISVVQHQSSQIKTLQRQVKELQFLIQKTD